VWLKSVDRIISCLFHLRHSLLNVSQVGYGFCPYMRK